MVISLKPGPVEEFPASTSANLILSQDIGPGGTTTDCTDSSARTSLVTEPESVVTSRARTTGRHGPSASTWTWISPTSVGSSSRSWIHCVSGSNAPAAVQAVVGSPSMACCGPASGTDTGQEPYDDAVTSETPVRTATV